MGAWGEGILQNDTAQDGWVEVIGWVTEDLLALRDQPSTASIVGRLSAMVGVLFQLTGWFPFSEKSSKAPRVREVLERHSPAFELAGAEAASLLRRVLSGEGSSLAGREGSLPAELAAALFGSGN